MSVGCVVAIAERETLSDLLLGGASERFSRMSGMDEVANMAIPSRGALIGYWKQKPEGAFPDFMVVRDEELTDTLAWTSSYLNSVTPITQWCRIWPQSQFQRLLGPLGDGNPISLGPWVGAIIAECSSQNLSRASLSEISGTVALTSASFAASRAVAVWGSFDRFLDLAKRYDELSARLKESSRTIGAVQMLPLWFAISGQAWSDRVPAEMRSLSVFSQVFEVSSERRFESPDDITDLIQLISKDLDLPELLECGIGPQPQRVEALDRLANRLAIGPKSASIDGILGLGASLVDIGAVVLPDLLRRHANTFPLASLWAGAFAGAWLPRRVLGDHNGLGRMILKEISRPSDLFGMPDTDISFDELARWIGSSASSVPVRGRVARTLNVELLPGTNAIFPVGRSEPARNTQQTTPRQRALDLESPGRDQQSGAVPWTLVHGLGRQLDDLAKRIDMLEQSGTKSRASSKAPKRKI